jgi:hypothetical protein
MLIASVDPHKAKIAIATWQYGYLVGVELVKAPIAKLTEFCRANSLRYDELAIEEMWIYPNERVKRPNDLLAVQKVVGLCRIMAKFTFEYTAAKWRGQVPEKTLIARIKASLSAEELAILGKYSNQPDILDAVGIGLKHLRRM